MKKKLIAFFCILTIAALMCSCAAKSPADTAYYDSGNMMAETPSAAYDTADKAEGAGAASSVSSPLLNYGQKIVYTTDMSIETKEFDKSYEAIIAAVNEVGGYVANRNSSGGYTSSYGDYYSNNASFTLKIPADKYQAFLEKGSSFGNVTRQQDSSDDITSQYIDTEARLDSLEAQKTQLMELLGKASTVEDIIAVQDRLTEVIYQIESYTSTIKTYDNMVAYCTVYIYLSEVTNITVHTDTFWEEIVEAVKGSARAVVEFLRGLVITLIYALPFLIIAFLIFLFVRKIVRSSRKKRSAKAVASESPFIASPEKGDKK